MCAVLPALVVGCGKKEENPQVSHQESQLREIHEIYQHFLKSEQKPPSQMSDLTKVKYGGIYPATVEALKAGKYVVVWGISSKDSGTVLAYDKDAPTKGGAVLMADGNVKTMTADELKAAAPKTK
jgi:hypothetical protein